MRKKFLLRYRTNFVKTDNASVNEKYEIEQLIHAAGAIIIWTAPYSPQLHPIEPCFEDYKDVLKSDDVATARHWYEAHLIALRNSVNRTKMLSYMRHCWHYQIPDNLSECKEQEMALAALIVQQQVYALQYLLLN